MLYDLLMPLFSVAMAGGGLVMVWNPEAIIEANPTLQLLQKHLPAGVTRRIVQALGLMVFVFFLGFFYVEYVL